MPISQNSVSAPLSLPNTLCKICIILRSWAMFKDHQENDRDGVSSLIMYLVVICNHKTIDICKNISKQLCILLLKLLFEDKA